MDENQEFMSALPLLFYPDEGMVKSQILVHTNQIFLQFCCQKSTSSAAHLPGHVQTSGGKGLEELHSTFILANRNYRVLLEQQQCKSNNIFDQNGVFPTVWAGCAVAQSPPVHARVVDKALWMKLFQRHDKMCID